MKVVNIIILILILNAGNISALELSLNSADTAPYSTSDDKGFYDVLLKEVFNNIKLDYKTSAVSNQVDKYLVQAE